AASKKVYPAAVTKARNAARFSARSSTPSTILLRAAPEASDVIAANSGGRAVAPRGGRRQRRLGRRGDLLGEQQRRAGLAPLARGLEPRRQRLETARAERAAGADQVVRLAPQRGELLAAGELQRARDPRARRLDPVAHHAVGLLRPERALDRRQPILVEHRRRFGRRRG